MPGFLHFTARAADADEGVHVVTLASLKNELGRVLRKSVVSEFPNNSAIKALGAKLQDIQKGRTLHQDGEDCHG